MKRLLFIILAIVNIVAHAQTIELVTNTRGDSKLFFEHTASTDNSTTYSYFETTYNGSSMADLFHEQKYWDAPLFIHAEYTTAFSGDHTILVGGAYCLYHNTGFVSFSPLYRWEYNADDAVQLTNVYLADFSKLELYGFNNLWYNGSTNFFGECRLHLKVGKHTRIGIIEDVSYFGSFNAETLVGFSYNF